MDVFTVPLDGQCRFRIIELSVFYHYARWRLPRTKDSARFYHMKKFLALAFLSGIVACTERTINTGGEPGGTPDMSTTADPGRLFAPLGLTVQAGPVTQHMYDYL